MNNPVLFLVLCWRPCAAHCVSHIAVGWKYEHPYVGSDGFGDFCLHFNAGNVVGAACHNVRRAFLFLRHCCLFYLRFVLMALSACVHYEGKCALPFAFPPGTGRYHPRLMGCSSRAEVYFRFAKFTPGLVLKRSILPRVSLEFGRSTL